MSFVQVLTEAECAEIAARPKCVGGEYVARCKNVVRDFLASKGIELNTDKASWEVRVDLVSTKDAKEWHHDDATLLNFVINVRGEGTSVLMEDGTIGVVPVGSGCVLVGDQGYTMLGLPPTLHRGPGHDNDRAVMKVALVPNYQITHWMSGESVCDEYTNVETYRERNSRVCHNMLLDADLAKVAVV
jgi:hypothetical protein